MKLRRTAGALFILWLLMLLSACASLHEKQATQATASIGPYSEFTGRLLVMEQQRRWQVQVQWKALEQESGWLRLTHAASNTIIELRWQRQAMQMRDNSTNSWQAISQRELADQGIVLPPRQLAALLLGKTPEHFRLKAGKDRDHLVWESRGLDAFIRLQWQESRHRLTMTDMTHGRRAILLIQP